jgi:SAM-dependent methyltransferase
MTTITPCGAGADFDALAPFYDAVTAHHRYDEWVPSLERIALEHGLHGRRLLDVACGTGKSFLPMLARGYEVTGCDASPGMLAHARRKTAGRVPLHEADMRALPDFGEFDLVTCIDEPLNYLLDPGELAAAFRSVARVLRPGGLYLFDVNTLAMYRGSFATVETYEAEGWTIHWRGLGHPGFQPGEVCVLEIDGDGPNGERHETSQTERHHPRAIVERHLADAELDLLAVYGQHMSGRQDPWVDELDHTKAIYLARK